MSTTPSNHKAVNQFTCTDMPERFWQKTVPIPEAGCLLFTGCVDVIGYGRFPYMGENKAHRVAWILAHGQIPEGMKVLHKCDVRSCVNPSHLFLGTQKDNVQDCLSKGRHRSTPRFGESNPMSRLKAHQVQQIKKDISLGASQISQAIAYGVSPMTISRIVRGESWK